MQKLGSLLWSGVTVMALFGIISSVVAPIALASPIVKITQPGHQQVIRGEVVIDVSYRSDSDQPITRLDLLIDGELARQHPLATPRTTGTQSFLWDFASLAGSDISVSARAVDANGETGTATITVSVAAAETSGSSGQDRVPPVINIFYPAQGAELSGEVEMRAEASDNVGVKYVFFYIDNKLHKMIMNTGPYVDLWDTTRISDGAHVLQAKAMDAKENAGASAEVTVFVKNHDMTAAPGSTVTEQPPAPTASSSTPNVGIQQSQSDTGRLAPSQEPTLAMAAGDTDAQASRVGYVPAIGDDSLEARTSAPGRMLATLPRSEPGIEQGHEVAADQQVPDVPALASSPQPVDDQQIASLETMPRMTTPRRLAAMSTHVVTPITEKARQDAPIGPQMAAATTMPRMTLPRTEIERLSRTGPVATEARDGWVVLEPILHLSPQRQKLAARTTTPELTLYPSETLSSTEMTGETLMVANRPRAEFGSIVARVDSRITMPERMLEPQPDTEPADETASATDVPDLRPGTNAPMGPAEVDGFTAVEGDTDAMRIAVLPEQASRAAIPADGRMTRPGEPIVAPVASTQFEDIKVLFDNEALELLASPEHRDGISIAPLREIFEHSDGMLYWYPVEKRVRATRPGTEMELQIGDREAKVNEQTCQLQVAPYIKKGRTMVPLQFLADTLDVTVTFNPDSGQICLTSNEF